MKDNYTVPLKVSHFKGAFTVADYVDNENCPLSKAIKEVIPNMGAVSEVVNKCFIGPGFILQYNHEEFKTEDFHRELQRIRSENLASDFVLREFHLIKEKEENVNKLFGSKHLSEG